MVILAVYYTFADFVLLAQCLWYWKSDQEKRRKAEEAGERGEEGREVDAERAPLLGDRPTENGNGSVPSYQAASSSPSPFGDRLTSVDGTHLSPATPLIPAQTASSKKSSKTPSSSALRATFFNTAAVLIVCAAGAFGWWLSSRSSSSRHGNDEIAEQKPDTLTLDPLGQVFGYLCAALYLGSRIPQLLLNYRRKSTEGVSMLFFLFACVGNATYVLSIFAYDPVCGRAGHGSGHNGCSDTERQRMYARYILVNTSWLLGSAGTLFLDFGIFVQFFLYGKDDGELEEAERGRTLA